MRNLDDMLESIAVLYPGEWYNTDGPVGWFAVSNDEGIIAYFREESDAFRFRLAEINRKLNG